MDLGCAGVAHERDREPNASVDMAPPRVGVGHGIVYITNPSDEDANERDDEGHRREMPASAPHARAMHVTTPAMRVIRSASSQPRSPSTLMMSTP